MPSDHRFNSATPYAFAAINSLDLCRPTFYCKTEGGELRLRSVEQAVDPDSLYVPGKLAEVRSRFSLALSHSLIWAEPLGNGHYEVVLRWDTVNGYQTKSAGQIVLHQESSDKCYG